MDIVSQTVSSQVVKRPLNRGLDGSERASTAFDGEKPSSCVSHSVESILGVSDSSIEGTSDQELGLTERVSERGTSERTNDGKPTIAVSDTSLELYRISHTADFEQAEFTAEIDRLIEEDKQSYVPIEELIALSVRSKVCVDKWAVTRRFVNVETGLSIPVFCKKYGCMRCGPLRIAGWRRLVELTEPERFATLSWVGDTMIEASRTVQTVIQRLRRNGYKFEYFVVFEHKERGFHAHMLQKGDFIPQKFLSAALASATNGKAYVTDIRACWPGAAGYVTKYVTKQLDSFQVGKRPDGKIARPHRVRHSKGFFSFKLDEMRRLLLEQDIEKKQLRGENVELLGGAWQIQQVAEIPRDIKFWKDGTAQAKYKELVADRVQELEESGKEVHHTKGDYLVLAYMYDCYEERVKIREVRDKVLAVMRGETKQVAFVGG